MLEQNHCRRHCGDWKRDIENRLTHFDSDKGNVMANEINGTGLSEMNVVDQLSLLKSILESSTEYSIIAKDLDGTILTWNIGASRLYGYAPDEIIGKHASILHDPDEIKSGKVKQIYDEVRRKGFWSGEITRIRKDGSHFTAFITITLRKDSSNNPIGYTLISRDITELQNVLRFLNKLEISEELLKVRNKELEEATFEAQESNRLKSEFIANVSHELRTPLNGIIGFAEMIYDGVVKPSSTNYKEFLSDIIASANQLLMLINDVLDLAKIEAGKMNFSPEKIDLTKLLAIIKATFQTLIAEKNIQLETKIDPGLPEIIIDAEKLKQVFYNYISNALKFTPSSGKVIVRVCPDVKHYFRLEVEDTGIGIRPEDMNKLFSKFMQLDSGTAKKYQGTGLGLALTKRIVEAQGGKVGVQSTFGKGSLFYAIFPCKPQSGYFLSEEGDHSQTKDIEIRPTILVVEQESPDKSLIVNTLKQEGYDVVTGETVALAQKHHHEQQVDAIILDLFQPDMKHWESVRKLRANYPEENVPPIVMKVMIEQPISFGFRIRDFLKKPLKPQELLSALNWLGASSKNIKSILVIDDDQKTLAFTKQVLSENGFRVICRSNKISGILALEKEQPDVVLLDPFMMGMDGFEFLRSYAQTERGVFTPLIIWTEAKLTQAELKHFQASMQRVVLTKEDVKKNILSELEKYLPPGNS